MNTKLTGSPSPDFLLKQDGLNPVSLVGEMAIKFKHFLYSSYFIYT